MTFGPTGEKLKANNPLFMERIEIKPCNKQKGEKHWASCNVFGSKPDKCNCRFSEWRDEGGGLWTYSKYGVAREFRMGRQTERRRLPRERSPKYFGTAFWHDLAETSPGTLGFDPWFIKTCRKAGFISPEQVHKHVYKWTTRVGGVYGQNLRGNIDALVAEIDLRRALIEFTRAARKRNIPADVINMVGLYALNVY